MTSSNQPQVINVATAKQRVANWNVARSNFAATMALINDGNPAVTHAFELLPTDTLHIPTGTVNVHGYLSSDGPNLQLILISDVEDQKVANGTTNLPPNTMCTLNYIQSSLPPEATGTYVERINLWQSNKDQWVQSVIISGQSNPDNSLVQVFDIPVSDLQNVLGSNTQAYLALKDTVMLEDEIELVFYKDPNNQFYDFTTPRPPFGGNFTSYGLL